MSLRFAIFLILGIIISGCTTTVIEEEERVLPEEKEIIDVGELSFEVDHSQSFIAFKGGKGGVISHEGKFEEFTLDIQVDPENPLDATLASAYVTIEIASVITDNQGLTKHLLSPDFFDADKYPQATFKTTSVTPTGEDTFDVEAELTIRGITQSVSFPITLTQQYLTFNYDLDRTQFGVGAPPGGIKGIDAVVPVEVKIIFE